MNEKLNKNGFTLVEIISVIAVLLVIATITVPSVISIKNNMEKKNQKRAEDVVYNAAELLAEKNRSSIEFPYYIRIKDLINLGFLKSNFNKYIGNSKIGLESCIKINKNDDNTLKYTLVDNDACIYNPSNPDVTDPSNPSPPLENKEVSGELINVGCGEALYEYLEIKFTDGTTATSEAYDDCSCLSTGYCTKDYCYMLTPGEIASDENNNCVNKSNLTITYKSKNGQNYGNSKTYKYTHKIEGSKILSCFENKYKPVINDGYYEKGSNALNIIIADKQWLLLTKKDNQHYMFLKSFFVDDFNNYYTEFNDYLNNNNISEKVNNLRLLSKDEYEKMSGDKIWNSDAPWKLDGSTWTTGDKRESTCYEGTPTGDGHCCGSVNASVEIEECWSAECPDSYYLSNDGYCYSDGTEVYYYVDGNGAVQTSISPPNRTRPVMDVNPTGYYTGDGSYYCPFK